MVQLQVAPSLRGRQFRVVRRFPTFFRVQLAIVGILVTYWWCFSVVIKPFSPKQVLHDVAANPKKIVHLPPLSRTSTALPNKKLMRTTATRTTKVQQQKTKEKTVTIKKNNNKKAVTIKKNNNKDAATIKKSNNKAITIGYAVSVTGCGPEPITEGGAVLKHAVHLTSVHGNMGGRYDYKFYAIYHPSAESCAMTLKDLGYEMVKRETPVAVKDIQGEYLRNNIERNGCCGEKELIKLEAYTFTNHPLVVHLDMDVLVLKPMDHLFDLMLANDPQTHDLSNVPIMWPNLPIPEKINAVFTRDYNVAGPYRTYKPVQGGFIVLRPDVNVYKNFIDIIREGDYRKGTGWGGIMGIAYGAMTFQGIIPYYYDVLHPRQSIELNRCVYNQMCDNPTNKPTIHDVVQGRCMTGQKTCEDCRSRPLEDVVTTHYTLCQKPWLCMPHDKDSIQHRLCKKLLHEWFRIRSDMEKSWGRSGMGTSQWRQEHFFGYCKFAGKKGYDRIKTPYGVP